MDEFRILAVPKGYLHRRDILENGGTDRMIRAALASGVLTRLRVGTYAFPDHLHGLDPYERHRLLAHSVYDKFPAGSVALARHSAAAEHGLALWGVDLDVVHIMRLDRGAGRSESGVHHHRWVPDIDVVEVDDGRLAIAPTPAAWQVACATGPRGALVVMDSGLHLGLVTKDELADTGGRFRWWHGSRGARMIVPMTDVGSETAGESLMRFVCFENRLPRPTTQQELFDELGRHVARTDLAWLEYRHVGEFDGLRKYLRDVRPGENASDVVVREKKREDQVRRLMLGMSRATYHEVQPLQSRRTGDRIRHELEQSRRLYVRGRRHLA